jgi:hypothetical protein
MYVPGVQIWQGFVSIYKVRGSRTCTLTARSAGDLATENGAQDGAESGTDWAAEQGIK